jgi:hypothetical protein
MFDSQSLEQLVGPAPSTEAEIAADGHVRKQSEILKDHSDPTLFRAKVDATRRVEPHPSVRSDTPPLGCFETGDRTEE